MKVQKTVELKEGETLEILLESEDLRALLSSEKKTLVVQDGIEIKFSGPVFEKEIIFTEPRNRTVYIPVILEGYETVFLIPGKIKEV